MHPEETGNVHGLSALMASSASLYGIGVRSSRVLSPSFTTACKDLEAFIFENCVSVSTGCPVARRVVEPLHSQDTRLEYVCASSEALRAHNGVSIRMCTEDGRTRCKRRIEPDGTFAFAPCSFLQHMCFLKGFMPTAGERRLAPQRIAPDMMAGAEACPGVYAYGNYQACRRHLDEFTYHDCTGLDPTLALVFNMPVINVLRVVSPRAPAKAGTNDSWAISVFHPDDVLLTGCIFPSFRHESLSAVLSTPDFQQGFLQVVLQPHMTLRASLRIHCARFAVGGMSLAYCDTLLLLLIMDEARWSPLLKCHGKRAVAHEAIEKAVQWLHHNEKKNLPLALRQPLMQWLTEEDNHFVMFRQMRAHKVSFIASRHVWKSVSKERGTCVKVMLSPLLLSYLRACHRFFLEKVNGDVSLLVNGTSDWIVDEAWAPVPAVGTMEFERSLAHALVSEARLSRH